MLSKSIISKLTKIFYAFGIIFLLSGLLLSAVSFPALAQEQLPESPSAAGAIWTTNDGCDNPAAQDENQYSVGEIVYIRGEGFDPSTALTWEIAGQPGSSTPGLIASGPGTTNELGYFCVTGHTIQPGEDGTYTVDVTVGNAKKNDNYRVNGIVAAPALTLDKTANPTTYAQVGDTISYSYLLTNSGNVALEEPFSVTDDKVSVNCSGAPATLAVGSSITCSASYSITQADLNAGFVTNVATGYAAYMGNQVTSNPDSATVNAIQNTGLTLDKNVSPSTYSAVGNVLSYTYLVTNTGNVTLSNLSVNDDKVSVTCPVDSLAPGASMTCTASYTINQLDLNLGSVTNIATAAGNDPNGVPVVSDPDSATATANQVSGLLLDKTVGETSFNAAGDILHYSYQLTNSGNVALDGPFSVIDNKATVDCSGAPATLAAGSSFSCTAEYMVTQADVDASFVTNLATGYAFYNGSPISSNQDTETVDAVQTPLLSLAKFALDAFYNQVGQVLDYEYVLRNTGNVTLNPTFSVSDDKTGTVICPQPTALAPGESLTCTASYTVNQADMNEGSVTNFANGQGYFGQTVVPTNQDFAVVNAQVVGPALELVKTVAPETFGVVGEVLAYTYELTNIGDVTLTGFNVDDDKTTVDCSAAATTLAPGASTTCTANYTITQPDLDARLVTNIAQAHGSFNGQAVDSEQDSATATAVQGPTLTLLKTVDPATFEQAGDVLSYSYLLTNSGNVTLSAPFTVDDDKTTVTCPDTPTSLAPGASITCTATYTVLQEDVDAGEVTNVATGHAAFGDQTIDSNEDSETAVVSVQGPSLVLDKTATPLTYRVAGDVISYSYELTNNGNVTLLAPFTVNDDKTTVTCPNVPTSLAPSEQIICTAVYIITTADLAAGSVTNTAQGQGIFDGQPVNSNEDSATVTVDLDTPVVTILAADTTTCAADPGEECITFTVNISGLLVGSISVFATDPAYLNVDEPVVFTENGEYQVTICGNWLGIADPAVGVDLLLAGYAEWSIDNELQDQVGSGSASVIYDPETQEICFPPVVDALTIDSFCYRTDGQWTMGVQVDNPNDEVVQFAWSVNGSAAQMATAEANGKAWLATLPLGTRHTIAVTWGTDGFAERQARLNLTDCQSPPPPPPPPPPVPPTGPQPIPVTAEQPSPVVESAELIPVTGVSLSEVIALGFFKDLMMYVGLAFLGIAFIIESFWKRFQ